MIRNRNGAQPCQGCLLRADLCICSVLVPLQAQTAVFVVMPPTERMNPTNTARIAERMIPHCTIQVRGHKERAIDYSMLENPGRELFLLHPDGEYEASTTWAEERTKPVTLVVADGTWAQAKKITQRESALHGMKRVRAPNTQTKYSLRKNAPAGGLCTIEAIAHTLGFLEGTHVRDALLNVFEILVERVSWARTHSDRYPMGMTKTSAPMY
jgi:DTW domain-containing protein